MVFFNKRAAETTLACPNCNKNLQICRTCHEAYMYCPTCQRNYPLKDFINNADHIMEEFLENLYMDRI